jgi:hypothetical protein
MAQTQNSFFEFPSMNLILIGKNSKLDLGLRHILNSLEQVRVMFVLAKIEYSNI